MMPLGAFALPAKAAVIIALNSLSKSDLEISPTDATVTYLLQNSGAGSLAGGTTTNFNWMTPATPAEAADYEVMADTFVGDALASGTLNTWLSLGSNRSWVLQETTNGNASKTCNFRVRIRHATTLVVHATATITMTVTVDL